MTHYIPEGAPEFRGVARANCGTRIPVQQHSSTPSCVPCASVEADLERGMPMPAASPALAEDYPEPDEVHPEPDTPMEPIATVATRVLGFRQAPAPPVVRDIETLEPGSANLVTTLEQAAVTLAVVEQSTGLIAQATALQVVDADSWLRGIDIFDILRSMEKTISDHYDQHVKRAHAVWNGLTAERRLHLQPVEIARAALGDRCAIWKAAEDRREREEKLRLERLAREEQQLAAARAAVQAERAGEPETAKEILEEARTAPLPAVAFHSSVPTSSKATTPLRWKCYFTDLPALLKAIGEGQFPEFHEAIQETLQPLLDAQVKTLKGELGKRYPGTEGRQKPSTAGRG